MISALYTCHVEAKLIHRDIKPENIMLSKEDDLTIVDFGISKKFIGEDDIVDSNRGTVLFFAPEMVRTGQVQKIIHGRCTDIWAAGVTLYMMATGNHPFESQHVFDYKTQVLTTEPDYSMFTKKDDVLFAELLKKMLCKNPGTRATVTELLDDGWLTRNKKNPIYLYKVIETDNESESVETDEGLDVISEDENDDDVGQVNTRIRTFPKRLISRYA